MMDDDIDIEEHDVLDDPIIRSIFPDLSVIKKEISIYNEDASTSDLNLGVTVIKSRVSSEDEMDTHYSDEENQTVCENFDLRTNINDSNADHTLLPTTSSNEYIPQAVHSNKIILGSGHSQLSKNYIDEKNVKLHEAWVRLKDIGYYLNKSQKFCKDCKILFLRKGDLNTHKDLYHKITLKNVNGPKHKVISGVFKTSKCGLCFKKFSNTINLKKHLKRDHKHTSLKKQKDFQLKKKSLLNLNVSAGNERRINCRKTLSSRKFLLEKNYRLNSKPKKQVNVVEKITRTPIKVKEINCLTANNHFVTEKEDHIPEKNYQVAHNNLAINKNFTLVYKCCYCSYYFNARAIYITHLSDKHKDSNPIDTKLMFDPNCKFCFYKASNMYSYNIHLQNIHKTLIDNTIKIELKICIPKVDRLISKNHSKKSIKCTEKESPRTNIKGRKANMPTRLTQKVKKRILSKYDEDEDFYESSFDSCLLVLKTVLFKCLRCDIYFVSAKSAMNHLNHMEILIHWKCLMCEKIFKKNDECVHKKQHYFTDNFTVYELNESQMSTILYKCSKCNIHFNDDSYASHFKSCDTIISDSTYCKDCDILVEQKFMKHHELEHKTKMLNSTDFIVIDSDVILSNSRRPDKKMNINNSKNQQKNTLNKLCYCDGCKCFISMVTLHKVHRQGQCTHMVKYVCKDCGLVFTAQAFQCHKKRHKFEKDLKLQDFTFYDIKNGKRIRPPVPEYPKCMSCNVHFLSKYAIVDHVCHNNEYLTCPVCEIKLSDAVFKLHVAFHHYSLKESLLPNVLLEVTKNVEAKLINTQANETTHQETKPDGCAVLMNSNHDLKKCETTAHKVEITPIFPHNSSNLIQTEVISEEQETDEIVKKSSDLKLFNVIYCCVSCYVTVDTFDKAVEHCQEHYSNINFELYTQKCNICYLKYDRRFYGDHDILHKLRLEDKGFTVFKFDAFYFAIDYKYWIQNLFESTEPKIVRSILDNSIYKHEGRIKLTVIKEGSSELIVYKCSCCRVYIDPDTMLSHCENSCFRQRLHPCSYCGLPFISHMCRLTHEIDHKKSPDVTIKSYKIVAFDRVKDQEYIEKILSSRNIFVMYKCRECHGIFDRFESRNHVCNKSALRKCLTCNLLLYSVNYKSHALKHTAIERFTHRNMRIIFFKQYIDDNASSTNGLPSTFNGIVSDYTFYKCTCCGLCFRAPHDIKVFKHDCTDDNAKIKCLKCQLYIMKKHTSQHIKKHDSDPFFIKENFNFIPYKGNINVAAADSTSELCENVDKTIATEEEVALENISKHATDTEKEMDGNKIHNDSISEKVAKIYKCNCGLHFLERKSIESHFGHCASRISKQKCSKCSLLFTPKELFAHLLKHHGDKKNVFMMTVIEMSQTKHKIIDLYKCSLCKLHFVEVENANEHYANCRNSESKRKECKICKLNFDSASIDVHESTQHADNVADFEIMYIPYQSNTDQLSSDQDRLTD